MEILQWVGIIVIAMITGTIIQMSYDRIKLKIQTLLSKIKSKPKTIKPKQIKAIVKKKKTTTEDAQICESIISMMESGHPIEFINKQLKISCYYMVRFMTPDQRVKWKKFKHNKIEFVYNKVLDQSATIENYKETTTEQITLNTPVSIPNERELLIDRQIKMYESGFSLDEIIRQTGKSLVAMQRYMTQDQKSQYEQVKLNRKYDKTNIQKLKEDERQRLVQKAIYAKKQNKTDPKIEKLLNISIKDLTNNMTIDEKLLWDKA